MVPEQDFEARNLRQKKRQENRRDKTDQDGQPDIVEGPQHAQIKIRAPEQHDEVIHSDILMIPADLVILKRHHRTAQKRIILPQQNRTDRRQRQGKQRIGPQKTFPLRQTLHSADLRRHVPDNEEDPT